VGAPGSGSDCNGPSPYEASVLAALLSAVVFTQSSAVPQAGTLKVGDLFPERNQFSLDGRLPPHSEAKS
jgi:hypothetical protein